MTLPRIKQLWTEYLTDVVPAAAGTAQREECQRAFYAGVQAMYLAVMEAITPDDEATCERLLTALGEELATYRDDFKQREGI